MVLIIDNYDSFTYNLVHYFQALKQAVTVQANDCISLSKIKQLKPSCIVLSPGPGTPSQAGITLNVIKHYYRTIPMFGVCLGHQAIGEAFGARIIKARKPMHGKTTLIKHDNNTIYQRLPNPLLVTRYHSLVIDPTTLPDCLEISAQTKSGEIMGIRLKNNPVPIEGVQFHPEAILTTLGKTLLQNFLKLC
ncbi:MAG: aminodeoxychorismate/anthranilate synthase component II [Patescibacteria group bacterium]